MGKQLSLKIFLMLIGFDNKLFFIAADTPRCVIPPFWEEGFGPVGNVDCPVREHGGWLPGAQCNYSCPEGTSTNRAKIFEYFLNPEDYRYIANSDNFENIFSPVVHGEQQIQNQKYYDLALWLYLTPPERWKHRENLLRPNRRLEPRPRLGPDIKQGRSRAKNVRQRSSYACQSRRRFVLAHIVLKVPRPGYSEVTFSVFQLLVPVSPLKGRRLRGISLSALPKRLVLQTLFLC